MRPQATARLTAGVAPGGAGIAVPLGGVSAFAAAGYNTHLGGEVDLTYLGVYAGLSIQVGS